MWTLISHPFALAGELFTEYLMVLTWLWLG